MDTELEKLRRFCVTAALVLITYLLAGITISPNTEVKLFDVPFIVRRSDLLPIGIVIACFFGMIRFMFYGFVKTISPYRNRRDLLNKLEVNIQRAKPSKHASLERNRRKDMTMRNH